MSNIKVTVGCNVYCSHIKWEREQIQSLIRKNKALKARVKELEKAKEEIDV